MKAIKPKFNITNVMIAVLSFLFLYASFIIWRRNNLNPLEHFLPLFLACYSIALGLVVSLAWSDDKKKKLLIILGGTFAGLFLVEVCLTVLNTGNPSDLKQLREKKASHLKISFDKRTKFEVVNDLKSKGENAWPNIGAEFYLDDDGINLNGEKIYPLGGISASKIVLCNENGSFSTHQSDEHGFNNPTGLYQEGIDLLILGDSFVHGACVDQGQDVASHLRSTGFHKTITLGNGGTGPLVALGALSEYGRILKPKTVLWFHNETSDLIDLENESKSLVLMSYLNDGFNQNLFNKQAQIDEALIHFYNQNINLFSNSSLNSDQSKLASLVKLRNLRQRLMLNDAKHVVYAPSGLFQTVIKTAKQRTNAWGGEFIFVYLPTYPRYRTSNQDQFDKMIYKNEILNMMKQLGIKTIDLTELVKTQADPLNLFTLRTEGHYTAEGYQLIAQYIHTQLADTHSKTSLQASNDFQK